MSVSDSLDFGHRDRKDLYEYVERHGTVPVEKARKELFPHDERRFVHQLAVLKRDGYLEEDEGELRASLEPEGDEEVFETDGTEYTIRPARQEDLGGVTGAIRQVAEERTYIVAESVAEQIDHQNVLLRHNEVESRVFFVALVDDEVVGWAHIEAQEMDKLRHTARLTFGVVDEYRGNGIGTRLFERALEWASENGYEKLYQSIPSTNEVALEFLDGKGCEVEARREDHYKIDGDYVDEMMVAVCP
jgi:GNAT superfamily N-acetyltransferase